MTRTQLPLIIEPEQLEKSAGNDNILIVDLSKPETYARLHVPDAVHLDYAQIVAVRKPAMGLLPDDATLARLFSAIGIDDSVHVVACDDEGGGRAARLLWTLEVCGHRRYSLLNGGLHAWANEGHAISTTPVTPVPRTFTVRHNDAPVAGRDYILSHLEDGHVTLLDVRSPAEFTGQKRFAERGGHIPGAVNMEWTEAIDSTRNLRLQPDDVLRALLAERQVPAANEIIAYCQTHHRSAHTWLVLKHLGYETVRGYPGSWSDWGNDPSLPVA